MRRVLTAVVAVWFLAGGLPLSWAEPPEIEAHGWVQGRFMLFPERSADVRQDGMDASLALEPRLSA
ncbi:MAG: hypothetical protein H7831_14815, partial [Magnetococcus sp. WYHC-3]